MTDDNLDDFLAHYGVLGMKWGRSRQRYLAGGKTRKERNRAETEYQIATSGGRKSVAALKVIGRGVATNVAINVGSLAVSAIPSRSVAFSFGRSALIPVAALVDVGNRGADLVRIAAYKEKKEKAD